MPVTDPAEPQAASAIKESTPRPEPTSRTLSPWLNMLFKTLLLYALPLYLEKEKTIWLQLTP